MVAEVLTSIYEINQAFVYLQYISQILLNQYLQSSDLFFLAQKSYEFIKEVIQREIQLKINSNFTSLFLSWEISMFVYSIRSFDILLRIWDFLIARKTLLIVNKGTLPKPTAF